MHYNTLSATCDEMLYHRIAMDKKCVYSKNDMADIGRDYSLSATANNVTTDVIITIVSICNNTLCK